MRWGQNLPEASLSKFSWLYILVWSVFQKHHEMPSVKKMFSVSFAINLF